MTRPLKSILPAEKENIHHLLAKECLAEGDNIIIESIPATQVLMSIFGKQAEEILRKEFGDEYESKMKQFQLASSWVGVIRAFKESIDNKYIDDKDLTHPKFVEYLKVSASLPLINPVIYEIRAILLRETQIKDFSIDKTIFTRVMPKEKQLAEIKMQNRGRVFESEQENV